MRAAPVRAGAREAALVREASRLGGPALAGPRQVARFLCGIRSPAITRAKLGGHERFGALAEIPFRVVLGLAEHEALRGSHWGAQVQ